MIHKVGGMSDPNAAVLLNKASTQSPVSSCPFSGAVGRVSWEDGWAERITGRNFPEVSES
jgi:hypothetical protein